MFSDKTLARGLQPISVSVGNTFFVGGITSVSIADINGDGFDDIWLGEHFGVQFADAPPNVYFGGSTGFVRSSEEIVPLMGDGHGSLWFDFDNDGDNDLLRPSGGDGSTALYVQSDAMAFTAPATPHATDCGCCYCAFADEAAARGVDNPEARGRDTFSFDVNADGLLDLVLPSGPRDDAPGIEVFLQEPDGAFGPPQPLLGGSRFNDFEVLGDVDGDGRLNVLLSDINGGFPMRQAELDVATGGFIDEQLFPATPRLIANFSDIVLADLNNDLQLDAYVGTTRVSPIEVLRVAPDEVVAAATRRADSYKLEIAPEAASTVLTVDKFGKASGFLATEDVVLGAATAQLAGYPLELDPTMPAITTRTFDPETSPPGLYIHFDPVRAVWVFEFQDEVKNAQVAYLRIKAGDGDTIASATPFTPVSASPADQLYLFDGDSLATVDAGTSLNSSTQVVLAADFDNNMYQDLYLGRWTNFHDLPDAILFNNGDGTFNEVEVPGSGQDPSSGGTLTLDDFFLGPRPALLDSNNDGYMDVLLKPTPVVRDAEDLPVSPLRLLENAGGDNNWLKLDLEGTVSNRDAIGARVVVEAGGVTQVREHIAGQDKWIQNTGIVHFGLGSNTVADMRIEWPSGARSVLGGVQANQLVRVMEPGAVAPTPVVELDPVGGLTGLPDDPAINLGEFPEKTVAVTFTTGDDVTNPQVIYEQGGEVRGLNLFVAGGKLFAAVWNKAEENWGYQELEADIQAGTRYVATLVMDGQLPADGTATLHLDGQPIASTGGVGQLYSHGNDIGIGQVAGATRIGDTAVTGPAVFGGTVEKLRLFNDALSGAALDQLNAEMAADGGDPAGGAAVLGILMDSDDVQASNLGAGAFEIANTGTKAIASVQINVTDALYPDTVFDPFGVAGDTVSKPLTIDDAGGTGVVAPSSASYLGTGGSAGFETIELVFDAATDGGFQPGEALSFAIDMDPNSIAGAEKAPLDAGAVPAWDVGGVSGAELIGSSFTVTFEDGTSATGQLQAVANQAGAQAHAAQAAPGASVDLTVNGLAPGEIGTYGDGGPSVVVSGPAGATARVVLSKGIIQPVDNTFTGDFAAQLDAQLAALAATDFPANNAAEFQFADVTLTGGLQDISDQFDFTEVALFDLAVAEDQVPLAFAAGVIDPGDDDLPLGPVTDPIYLDHDTVL